MKRPKNTIKSVFILICLFSLILGGVFAGFEKVYALECTQSCTYGCDTLTGTCYDSPESNPLISNPAPQQTFQSKETPSAQENPGSPSVGELSQTTYASQMKQPVGWSGALAYICGKILTYIVIPLVVWAIKLGTEIAGLEAVKLGWKVILDFTNLGFVLAIIVIAFSTILQIQNYAMKKVLWKLIVAALLVNFSLVIAGSLLDMSNIVSVMFLNKINNGNLADALGSAMQPQQFMATSTNISGWRLLTGGLSYLLQLLASLAFMIIFMFLMILALVTLFIMIMIRNITIVLLLIISPVIWLCWIFPSTHKYWKQWWEKFTRWLIFLPASLFFVYLSISMMQAGRAGEFDQMQSFQGLKTQVETVSFGGNSSTAPDFIQHGAKLILFAGVLIGGLFVANSFGIAGGGLGITWAEKAGKGVGRWAGRKGARAGTWATRKAGVEKFAENLQKGEKGIYKAAKYLGGRNLGNVLRVGTAQQREKLIKQADEGHKKYSDKELALRVPSMSADERTAALTRLAKNKNLDMVPNAAKYIADEKTKKIFESYGQVVAYGNLEKALGANTAMLNAKTEEDRKKSAEEFYEKFSKDDWKKVQFNDVFATKSKLGLADAIHESLQEAIAHGIAMNNPGDVRKIILNVKPENFVTAHSAVTRVSSDIRAKGDKDSIDIADQISNALKKTLTKRFEGELFDYDYGAPPSSSPTTPTT